MIKKKELLSLVLRKKILETAFKKKKRTFRRLNVCA